MACRDAPGGRPGWRPAAVAQLRLVGAYYFNGAVREDRADGGEGGELRSEYGTHDSHRDGEMDNRMSLVRNDDVAYIALVDQFLDLLRQIRPLHMVLLTVALFLIVIEIALSHAGSAFLFFASWYNKLDTGAFALFRLFNEKW